MKQKTLKTLILLCSDFFLVLRKPIQDSWLNRPLTWLKFIKSGLRPFVTSFRLISISNKIAPSVSGVDRSRIIFVWFPDLPNRLSIVPLYMGSIVASFWLILMANKITPNGSDIDRSQIVLVWFPVLINRLRIVPLDLALIVTRLYQCVDIDSQENLSCTWIDTFA